MDVFKSIENIERVSLELILVINWRESLRKQYELETEYNMKPSFHSITACFIRFVEKKSNRLYKTWTSLDIAEKKHLLEASFADEE